MSRTIEIPGGSAVFRDREELRGRDQNLIQAAAMAAAPALAQLPDSVTKAAESGDMTQVAEDLTEAPMSLSRPQALALLELKECVAVALLKSWTLPIPLPTVDTIGDLEIGLYTALCDAAGGMSMAELAVTNFEPSHEPESPFTDSASSNGHLEAEAESPSIPSLPSTGESTDIEVSTISPMSNT